MDKTIEGRLKEIFDILPEAKTKRILEALDNYDVDAIYNEVKGFANSNMGPTFLKDLLLYRKTIIPEAVFKSDHFWRIQFWSVPPLKFYCVQIDKKTNKAEFIQSAEKTNTRKELIEPAYFNINDALKIITKFDNEPWLRVGRHDNSLLSEITIDGMTIQYFDETKLEAL